MPNNHGCITLDQFGPSDSISDLGLVVRGDLGVTPDGSQIQIFLFLRVSDKKGKTISLCGSLMFLDKPSRFGQYMRSRNRLLKQKHPKITLNQTSDRNCAPPPTWPHKHPLNGTRYNRPLDDPKRTIRGQKWNQKGRISLR